MSRVWPPIPGLSLRGAGRVVAAHGYGARDHVNPAIHPEKARTPGISALFVGAVAVPGFPLLHHQRAHTAVRLARAAQADLPQYNVSLNPSRSWRALVCQAQASQVTACGRVEGQNQRVALFD